MDKMTKDVIMECEEADAMTERSLAMDVICYVNGERKKWKTACIIMIALELVTIAGIILYVMR